MQFKFDLTQNVSASNEVEANSEEIIISDGITADEPPKNEIEATSEEIEITCPSEDTPSVPSISVEADNAQPKPIPGTDSVPGKNTKYLNFYHIVF